MKKNIVLAIIAVVLVIVAFVIYGYDKYSGAIERGDYWKMKYESERAERLEDNKYLSWYVQDAYRNGTIKDHGLGLGIWFEDLDFCKEGHYCAAYISGDSFYIFK